LCKLRTWGVGIAGDTGPRVGSSFVFVRAALTGGRFVVRAGIVEVAGPGYGLNRAATRGGPPPPGARARVIDGRVAGFLV